MVVMITIAIAVCFMPIMPGYKVTVHGVADYNILSGWSVVYNSFDQALDPYLFSTEGLWWWDTDATVVVVTLQGDYIQHKAEVKSGSTSSWIGGHLTWDVSFRHLIAGDYDGTVELYEIKDTFFGFGGHRELKETDSFSLTIVETP